jgi:hypothetical protein
MKHRWEVAFCSATVTNLIGIFGSRVALCHMSPLLHLQRSIPAIHTGAAVDQLAFSQPFQPFTCKVSFCAQSSPHLLASRLPHSLLARAADFFRREAQKSLNNLSLSFQFLLLWVTPPLFIRSRGIESTGSVAIFTWFKLQILIHLLCDSQASELPLPVCFLTCEMGLNLLNNLL